MDDVSLAYKEYVRLQEVLNSYVNSSFADFQLLAAIGFLLAWEPLSKRLSNIGGKKINSDRTLFLGFVAIAFVLFIIAARDLMKQSIIFFYLKEIERIEPFVQSDMSEKIKDIFQISSQFKSWMSATHSWVSIQFRGLSFLFISIFPTMLLWKENKKYAKHYLSFVLILLGIYCVSNYRLYNSW